MSDDNNTAPQAQKTPGAGRGLRIALGVSLAINLLIVGIIAGAFLSGRPGERASAPGARPGAEMSAVGLYGRALSREDRRAIGRALMRNGPGERRALRRALRELAQEAVVVLSAEPFDAGRFGDILMQQQSLIKGRSDDARDVLLAHVAAMSADERRAYAEGLERALVRGPGKR